MSRTRRKRPQVNDDGSASTTMLGLPGLVLVAVSEVDGELEQAVETTSSTAWCQGCGVAATAHGRRVVRVRDPPCGGRPTTLLWLKRLWRCGEWALGDRAEQAPELPHGRRCRGVVTDDVPDHEDGRALTGDERVVSVAADRRVRGRPVPDDDVQVVRLGRVGEQRPLQRDGGVPLLCEQQRVRDPGGDEARSPYAPCPAAAHPPTS